MSAQFGSNLTLCTWLGVSLQDLKYLLTLFRSCVLLKALCWPSISVDTGVSLMFSASGQVAFTGRRIVANSGE